MKICDECKGSDHVEGYIYPDDTTQDLCYDCAIKGGFCVGCGSLCAGIESYDFSSVKGYCYDCVQDLELIEEDDPDWSDPDYDPYMYWGPDPA